MCFCAQSCYRNGKLLEFQKFPASEQQILHGTTCSTLYRFSHMRSRKGEGRNETDFVLFNRHFTHIPKSDLQIALFKNVPGGRSVLLLCGPLHGHQGNRVDGGGSVSATGGTGEETGESSLDNPCSLFLLLLLLFVEKRVERPCVARNLKLFSL